MKKIMTILGYILFFIFATFSFLLTFSSFWAKSYFKNVGISEMVYTLSQPLTGSDSTQIKNFLYGPLVYSILFGILFLCIFLVMHKKILKGKAKFLKIICSFFFCICLLVSNLVLSINKLGYTELRNYFIDKTKLYDTYYVDPQNANLVFPDTKRNLIYIYVESLESTYASTEVGGAEKENLIPNLTDIALSSSDAISFSNNDQLGGSLPTPGTGFTVGGMVAQSSGIPLKVAGAYNENEYGNTESFMPGAYSIGDILAEKGYRQILLLGSDANFAGRSKYYSQHGDYELRDYYYAIDHQWIPEDYSVWWGYEDQKLFEFAKQTLSELSATPDQPFNFTMLTADTHFPDGYVNEQTPTIFDNQYSNVIHFSDAMLGDFISWIKEQPFYENTTIVVSGDHLSMGQDFFADISTDYQRTVFNTIINSPITTDNNKNRAFDTMDLYPTTLAALGVDIEGNRLGLGTNLFSNTPTLAEELGYDNLVNELEKKSTYYESKIMKGSDILSTPETIPSETIK